MRAIWVAAFAALAAVAAGAPVTLVEISVDPKSSTTTSTNGPGIERFYFDAGTDFELSFISDYMGSRMQCYMNDGTPFDIDTPIFVEDTLECSAIRDQMIVECRSSLCLFACQQAESALVIDGYLVT